MSVKSGKLLCLLTGGPVQKLVDSSGKVWLFEMHSYCGPAVLRRDLELAAAQPGSRSKFWTAFELWRDQGRKTRKAKGEHPWCVWKYPPKCENCGHYENAHVDARLNRGHSCVATFACACEGWKGRAGLSARFSARRSGSAHRRGRDS